MDSLALASLTVLLRSAAWLSPDHAAIASCVREVEVRSMVRWRWSDGSLKVDVRRVRRRLGTKRTEWRGWHKCLASCMHAIEFGKNRKA